MFQHMDRRHNKTRFVKIVIIALPLNAKVFEYLQKSNMNFYAWMNKTMNLNKNTTSPFLRNALTRNQTSEMTGNLPHSTTMEVEDSILHWGGNIYCISYYFNKLNLNLLKKISIE